MKYQNIYQLFRQQTAKYRGENLFYSRQKSEPSAVANGLNSKTNEIYQLNNSTSDEIRANLKLIFTNPALQNNETLVDQFMTQRITANDGYTINSLMESIKRKEDFLNNRLGEIKKPTLIIWGKQDGLIPVADATTFNKEITNSELVIFDNCGHVPQFEKASDFNKKVLEFLGKN